MAHMANTVVPELAKNVSLKQGSHSSNFYLRQVSQIVFKREREREEKD